MQLSDSVQDLMVDEVRIKLANANGEPLWLTAEKSTLKPGRNVIRTESLVGLCCLVQKPDCFHIEDAMS
jgi:hypothetical protein